MPENAKNRLRCPCSICKNIEFCKFKEAMETYVSKLNTIFYPECLLPTIIDCVILEKKELKWYDY